MIFQEYFLYFFIVISVKLIVFFINLGLKFSKSKKSKVENCNFLERPQKQQKNDESPFKAKFFALVIGLKKYLENLVTLKEILAIFIGSHMIFIAFSFASQLRIMFSFQTIDMINICVTVLYGFIILGFICLIFVGDHLGKSKTVQIKKKSEISQQKRLILYDTYFVNLKNLLNGSVHGFFIDDPSLQYPLLILIKVGLIYIVLKD
jgi:hypothetical protein